ncbi:MAG: hypothetical protein WC533_01640 [Candidatus Pacearchaeota archaeon]
MTGDNSNNRDVTGRMMQYVAGYEYVKSLAERVAQFRERLRTEENNSSRPNYYNIPYLDD